MTDKIDISPEAVERLARHLNDDVMTDDDIPPMRHIGNARDTLRALSARLAEVEAERDALIAARDIMGNLWSDARDRAEAAEAKLGKAMEALRAVERLETTSANGTVRNMAHHARAALAEIGEGHE